MTVQVTCKYAIVQKSGYKQSQSLCRGKEKRIALYERCGKDSNKLYIQVSVWMYGFAVNRNIRLNE